MSSRSKNPVAPFGSMMPMTVKVTPRILICCPSGSVSGKSSPATVCPSTATFARRRMSASLMNDPAAGWKLRTAGNWGVTAETCV